MNDSNRCMNLSEQHSTTKRGKFPPPIAELLGFRLTSAGSGRATVQLEAQERHSNPMGTLHGGVLCDIADAAMGIAYSTTLAPEETFTTVELKINFLRPVWKAKLRAEARIIHAGKLIGLVECDIFDEQRQLVARASSTCMTLSGARAAKRALPVDLAAHLKEARYSPEQHSAQHDAEHSE
jgi:uncharacterized protein (TIGR00369 family)